MPAKTELFWLQRHESVDVGNHSLLVFFLLVYVLDIVLGGGQRVFGAP
jgi:hypothetical protein